MNFESHRRRSHASQQGLWFHARLWDFHPVGSNVPFENMVHEYFRHFRNLYFPAWFLRYNIVAPSGIWIREAWASPVEWWKWYFLPKKKDHQWCCKRGLKSEPHCSISQFSGKAMTARQKVDSTRLWLSLAIGDK